jgi:hypothetical protein
VIDPVGFIDAVSDIAPDVPVRCAVCGETFNLATTVFHAWPDGGGLHEVEPKIIESRGSRLFATVALVLIVLTWIGVSAYLVLANADVWQTSGGGR